MNQKGFGLVGTLLVIVVVALVGFAGWTVYDRQTDDAVEITDSQTSVQNQDTTPEVETDTVDPNEGYLVVKEWSLRFKVPNDLKDVEYAVLDDVVAFYAKPTSHTVAYRSDYKDADENGTPRFAKGQLYRNTESTIERIGLPPVEGRKIGDYYYYTAHAFSSLATGAGYQGLYFDAACDADIFASPKCDEYIEAESKVLRSMNQGDTAMLDSIEIAE